MIGNWIIIMRLGKETIPESKRLEKKKMWMIILSLMYVPTGIDVFEAALSFKDQVFHFFSIHPPFSH